MSILKTLKASATISNLWFKILVIWLFFEEKLLKKFQDKLESLKCLSSIPENFLNKTWRGPDHNSDVIKRNTNETYWEKVVEKLIT